MARHNWELIEDFYIRGKVDPTTGESMDLSMADICKAFNIKAKSTVKLHIDKDNWRAKREEYKTKLNETIKKRLDKMDIEGFVEFRKRLLKLGLGELVLYGKRLEAGEIEIKPVDVHRTREWLLEQYHMLFGVESEPAKTSSENTSKTSTGELDDDYGHAVNIFNRKRNRKPETN